MTVQHSYNHCTQLKPDHTYIWLWKSPQHASATPPSSVSDRCEHPPPPKALWPDETSPQSHITTKVKKKRRRRKLDMHKSIENYRRRILSTPELFSQLHELRDAYLSTFAIFSTEKNVRTMCTNPAFVLMEVAREHGIHVKGVTSECTISGEFRAPLLGDDTRETAKVIYVGNYNYFTGHPESKWAMKPCDKAYFEFNS